MIIFDSNIWISAYHKLDSLHERAKELYFSIENEPIYVPEYVWIEVSTILEQKAEKNSGRDFLDTIEYSESMEMLYFTQEEAKTFMEFYRSGAPKGLSFIDATLLLLSKKHTVYTFDKTLEKAIKSK